MKKNKTGLLFTGAALAAAALARSEYEKKHFVVRGETVTSPLLPAAFHGWKIVFLSDLHGQTYGEGNEQLLRAIRAAEPDLILCGGDSLVVKKGLPDRAETALDLWEALSDLHVPMYTGLGNHEERLRRMRDEYGDLFENYRDQSAAFGMITLDDGTVRLEKDGGSLYIAGVTLPEKYYKVFGKEPMDPAFLTGAVGKRKGFTVLLAHSPLYFPEYAAWGADLTLAGHFHGGTVSLPGLGGVMTPNYMFFPQYDKGRYERDGKVMLLSAGLGTHSVNVRLNCRPELYVITLRRG